LTAVVKAYCCW